MPMNVARVEIKGRDLLVRAHHGGWKQYRLTKAFAGTVSISHETCLCKNCKAKRAAKKKARA